MGLSTPFTRAFNLTVPVCLAPMVGVSGGRLAAAVARGGGLGVIGAGSFTNTSQLDEEIRIFRDEAPPGAKLAIGIISWSLIGGNGYGVTQRGVSASLLLQNSSHGSGSANGSTSTNGNLFNGKMFNGNVGGDGGSSGRSSCGSGDSTTAVDSGSASGGSTAGEDVGGGGRSAHSNGGTAGTGLGDDGLANGAGSVDSMDSDRGGEGGGGEEPGSVCSTARLETLLERYQPQALWFFAPATPCKEAYTICQARGVDIIAQVGTVGEARAAVEMGASVVVAQGREAGGHGLRPDVGRGTLPLAAAVAVELAETGRPVLAAGGVVSGRGVLAALALGCDGVVMGTRYCATYEALVSDNHKAKLVSTSGDDTVRTRVYDMAAAARPIDPTVWPVPYDSSGVAVNAFTKKWNTREQDLAFQLSKRDKASGHSAVTAQLEEADRTGDLTLSRLFMGEGAGLIYSVDSAEKITRDVAREAEEQLDNVNRLRTRSRSSELDAANRTRASIGKPASSLSANNIDDLELRDEAIFRHKRANTVSVSDLSNPMRLPGTRQVISSGSAYEKLAGYSRAVRVGKHVQVAGTTATDPDGSGVLCVGDVGGQTQYIFHIIALALREAGCSLENVVRTRMYVTDIGHAEKVMEEHNKVFSNIRPAATLVCVGALVHPELLVEIEADALEP